MNHFWIGIGIGMFIGVFLGIVIGALCMISTFIDRGIEQAMTGERLPGIGAGWPATADRARTLGAQVRARRGHGRRSRHD